MPEKTQESAGVLASDIAFVKDHIPTDDEKLRRQIIDRLGRIWSFKKPPKEFRDDVLKAKVMLMDAVNGINEFKGSTASLKQHANNVLWSCVQDYAMLCIHNKAKTYVNTGNPVLNRENVMAMTSEMWCATAKYIHTYDPERAAPITFLKQCFFHGIFDWKKSVYSIGTNTGMTTLVKRVENTIHIIENEGREVTLALLHEYIPSSPLDQLQTALITLEAKNNMASMENCSEILETRSSTLPTPEESIIKDEQNKALYSAIHSLPDDEKEVFCMANGVDLSDDSISLTPLSESAISKITERKVSEVTSLLIKAKNDLYTILTGHRRNDRESPNHTETENCTCSCDTIQFCSEEDDFVDDEILAETVGAEEAAAFGLTIREEKNGQLRMDFSIPDKAAI